MPACRYRTRSGKIPGVVPMLHVLLLFKRFAHTLRKDRLDRVLLALLVITLVGMLGIAYFDSLSLADSLWWTIVRTSGSVLEDLTLKRQSLNAMLRPSVKSVSCTVEP